MYEPKLIRYNGHWKQDESGDWYYYEDVDQILENRDKLIRQQAEQIEILKGKVCLAQGKLETAEAEIKRLKEAGKNLLEYCIETHHIGGCDDDCGCYWSEFKQALKGDENECNIM